ncbi:MAG: triose-phosphate isomerase [Chloroflexi bacterium]|nr:triose-phosphate isomerase [Chloroflexota bacterium]
MNTRKPIIAGNWKMNKTIAEAVDLVRGIRAGVREIETVEAVVCPPFVALPTVADALSHSNVKVGAQNVFYEEKGAFTGEIAPGMLEGLVTYCIIGHSERRNIFGECDEWVNKKAKALLAHGITPIICVGESLEQNQAGETDVFVRGQVEAALAGLSAEQVAQLIIAYEPIWAIGTGLTATPAEANRTIGVTIRGVISDLYDESTAQAIRIQYGGSAKPGNIAELMAQPDIDGALVGGASLKADSFVEMIRLTAEVYRS